MLNSIDKFIEIFKKSGLSVSKFATSIEKDRRTVANWLEKNTKKELDNKIKEKICEIFRYPVEIWDSKDSDFYQLLSKVKNDEIRLIDEGYVGGLKYIFENENEGSLILHPAFPNPAYRDFIVPFIYKNIDSDEAKIYRAKRGEKMRDHSFGASEWYSIKSLMEFCFSPIGNFYTKEQKIAIFDLMIAIFKDNLNKFLYFFDSYDKKIYGLDMFYLSINVKQNSMFFKAPIEMFIVEIRNSLLIRKIHHHYTNAKECPVHIDPKDASKIMELLKYCLKENFSLLQSVKVIDENSNYGELFKKVLSIELRDVL